MPDTHAKDVTRIQEIIDKWAKAVDAKDIDGTVANHSADIFMFDVPLQASQLQGIAAYKESFERFFPWIQAGFKLSDIDITAGSDVAFCHALIHCGITRIDESGGKIEVPVRLTIGLRKSDGDWEITHEHHSLPDLQGAQTPRVAEQIQ